MCSTKYLLLQINCVNCLILFLPCAKWACNVTWQRNCIFISNMALPSDRSSLLAMMGLMEVPCLKWKCSPSDDCDCVLTSGVCPHELTVIRQMSDWYCSLASQKLVGCHCTVPRNTCLAAVHSSSRAPWVTKNCVLHVVLLFYFSNITFEKLCLKKKACRTQFLCKGPCYNFMQHPLHWIPLCAKYFLPKVAINVICY